LIPHEQFLAGSYYGKYFAKNLNLPLLRRQPEEWKNLQAAQRSNSNSDAHRSATTEAHHETQAQSKASALSPSTSPQEADDRRRAVDTEDEIDALFDASLGKRVRRSALETGGTARDVTIKSANAGRDLEVLLSTIRAAPREKRKSRHKY
jgi:nucleolar protein 9